MLVYTKRVTAQLQFLFGVNVKVIVRCACNAIKNQIKQNHTPRSVASDLGLHCLSMPHRTSSMLIRVKEKNYGLCFSNYLN